MAYDSSVPASGHTPAQDRSAIQGNFAQLATSYNTDHVALTSGTNVGAHSKVTLPVAAAPGSTAGTLVLSSNTANANSELYLQRDGVATAIQMTRGSVLIGASSASDGYTFLPGGVLLQWCTRNATPGGNAITFPIAFTSYVFSVTFGPRAAGAQAFAMGVASTTGVTLYSQSGTQAVYLMAIGV